ncbi:hypothetical protein E4T56_gene13814 [Termitomyces sp. T112]|nr:hypothetical protein E4T56_gene13814 [Termitomyces sp. T112]
MYSQHWRQLLLLHPIARCGFTTFELDRAIGFPKNSALSFSQFRLLDANISSTSASVLVIFVCRLPSSIVTV